jgi:hypothetical protein
MGPRAGLDDVEKRKILDPAGTRTPSDLSRIPRTSEVLFRISVGMSDVLIDILFLWLFSLPKGKWRNSTSIGSILFLFKSFPIHYSPVILPVGCTRTCST